MSSRNIIRITALAAIACAGAITGVTLGVTDSGYAALPPATARDPAPPIPPPRWAEIMHRRPQPVWHSVGEYLDYLAYWRAPVWPVEPTAAWQCDLCRPGWKPERKFWWRIPT
jgi:hypothetical protein